MITSRFQSFKSLNLFFNENTVYPKHRIGTKNDLRHNLFFYIPFSYKPSRILKIFSNKARDFSEHCAENIMLHYLNHLIFIDASFSWL